MFAAPIARLRRLAAPVIRVAFEIVFPARCAACRAFGEAGVCDSCVERIVPAGPRCARCGGPARAERFGCRACAGRRMGVERAIVAGPYEGKLRHLVRGLKYSGRTALAEPLGRLLSGRVEAARVQAEVVVPVPLDPSRERERGFNQAELVAREVARRLHLPLAARALARVKATPALYSKTRDERAAAIEGAFQTRDPREIAGKRVLLVDDVLTTGATLAACADALREAGAWEVIGACIARKM